METSKNTAVITGAGTGIGRHFALALLKNDYRVVLAGRRREPLEETVAAAGASASNALIVPTDVSDPQAVKALFARTKEVFGRLDLLFNNAGIFGAGLPLEELSFDQWKSVVDINLTGAFLCTQETFKIMKAQNPMGGRIINNGSLSAHVPRPNSAPYTASKHAISGLTKSTALEGRRYNIACGQIDIGNAATDMTEKMKKGVPQADGSLATEPTIDLEHVTQALLYMCGLPLGANVPSLTVMATMMPFVGRG
jgi:NAD(P)-dependent dehydrogenase (short-subunit alcohol dehydrogenase family)